MKIMPLIEIIIMCSFFTIYIVICEYNLKKIKKQQRELIQKDIDRVVLLWNKEREMVDKIVRER